MIQHVFTPPPPACLPATSLLQARSKTAEQAELIRLTYRLGEVARLLGISRRTLERERSAGRFPPPDLKIGKAPLWKRESLERWIAKGGSK